MQRSAHSSAYCFLKLFPFVLMFFSLMQFSCKEAPSDAPEIVTKITGIVTDKVSGSAMSGVQITTAPITSTVTTDASGKYEISKIPSGTYTIKALKNGYKNSQISVNVTEGGTASADIQIEEMTAELDVSPTFVDFGTGNAQAVIAISNKSSIGTINYTISKNAGWLSLSEASGSITTNVKNITLTVDRSQVQYGSYNDVVTIVSNVGNRIVNVQMVKENPNAPQLTVSPVILDFGTSQNQLSITLSNTGTGTVNWTSSTGDGWISASPASGSIGENSTTAIIKVNRTGLTPGNYNGSLTFSSNGGNQTVNIKMQIPQIPILNVNPSSLDFGGTENSYAFQISNAGSGTLNWNVNSNKSWLKVNFQTGTNASGVIATVSRTNLAQGNYEAVISVTSNGGNVDIPVKMTVPPPQPPAAVTLGAPKEVTYNSLKLSWTQSDADNYVAYKIYRSTQSDVSDKSTLVATINNISSTSYQVTNLMGNTQYYFRVYTVNSVGLSSGSNTVTVTTPMPEPPAPVILGAPFNVAVNSLKLNWAQSGAADFASYKIYMDTKPDVNESSTLAATITNVQTTEYQLSGLAGNTQYYFRIYVVNSKGGSAGSNTVNATTEKTLGTWSVAITLSGVNPRTCCLFPVSETNVWVVGNEIWHYNGSTWAKDLKPSGIGKLWAVYFSSPTEGWAVGENATVIRYNGSTWSKVTSSVFPTTNTSYSDFYNVVLSSGNDVWISGYGAFYHFDGTNWTKNTVDAEPLLGMDLVNANEIWATDRYNSFKYNGIGWSKVAGHSYIYDQSAFGSNKIWLSTSNGVYSYDGLNFNKNITLDHTIYSIDFFSDNDGWAGGVDGYFSHYNGNAWKEVNSPINSVIECIKMTSSSRGWAVSSGGEILRYYDPLGKRNLKKR